MWSKANWTFTLWNLNFKQSNKQIMYDQSFITLESSQTHLVSAVLNSRFPGCYFPSFFKTWCPIYLSTLWTSSILSIYYLLLESTKKKIVFFLQPKHPHCHTRIVFYLFLLSLWVGQEYLRRPSWDIEVILYTILKNNNLSHCFVSNKR